MSSAELATEPGRADAALEVQIEHETLYRYESAVELAQHQALLRPREEPGGQRVLDFELRIEPAPSHRRDDIDVFDNRRSGFSIAAPHRHLRVLARSRIAPGPREIVAASPPWDEVAAAARYRAGAAFDPALAFRFASPLLPPAALADAGLQSYARASFGAGRPLHEAALELMHRVHADWRYRPQSTTVATPVLEAFARREGVCQDFAQLMLAMLRGLGLSARYVSGYLVEGGSAAPLLGARASHAWVAVACPQADGASRWLELDPTNDCTAGEAHVRLALGRDYADVAPLRGVIRGGGAHVPAVHVRVRRIDPDAAAASRLAQSVQGWREGQA
jgi:transglutaminase-like putative cysteine protease